MKTAKRGFSMLETLSALVIAGLLLTALFMIYDHARRISVSVLAKIDEHTLPTEILQRISEDLDRLAGPGSSATVEIKNNYASGLPGAQLIITSRIVDKDKKPQVLEEIIWQTSFDLSTKRLILWRSHAGLAWEDKLLDREERQDWTANRHVFVPLCTGLSYFRIQVPQYEQQDNNQPNKTNTANFMQTQNFRQQQIRQQRLDQQVQEQSVERKFLDTWNQGIPPAVTVTLSFEAPVDTGTGSMDVMEDQKSVRTILLNRTKKIAFNYVPLADANTADANSVDPNSAEKKTNADNSVAQPEVEKESTSFRRRPASRRGSN